MNVTDLWRGETRSTWLVRVVLYVAVVATMTLAIQLLTWLM